MKPSWRSEKALWQSGYASVAGVDEVGRGAWAGPIIAAAVLVLPQHHKKLRGKWVSAVRDSKLLTPKSRERIFTRLCDEVEWALGVVNNKVIDQVGIAEANRRAIRLAVANLPSPPHFVLVDYVAKLGGRVNGIPAKVTVDGDATVFCIAAASIIAKVQRDRLMGQYELKYPGFGFAQHKGYGTPEHQRALNKLGVSPLHRRSYRPVQAHLV